MTRHVKIYWQSVTDGESETDTNSLSKRIFDTVNGKTLVSVALNRMGLYALVLLIYDDS